MRRKEKEGDVDEISMGGLFHKRQAFSFLCKSFDPVKYA